LDIIAILFFAMKVASDIYSEIKIKHLLSYGAEEKTLVN
jgi:hypothetical protein